MSEFTCLAGETALSEFRLRKLQRASARALGHDSGDAGLTIEATFAYFVESPDALSAEDLARLGNLLHARHRPAPPGSRGS